MRAQELLQQAEAAQAQLRTSTFDGSVSLTAEGMNIRLAFTGATAPAGEWFSLRSSGIPGGDMTMEVLNRKGRVSANTGSGWKPLPGAATATGGTATMSAEAFQQLARHVRDVRVTEHQPIDGKLKTIVAGEIDTKGMIAAAASLSSIAPKGSFDLADAGLDLGDISALLTIDETSHLLDTAFVTFSMQAQGKRAKLELRYRLATANEPVQLPQG